MKYALVLPAFFFHITLLFSHQALSSENFLFLFGGGGEPKNSNQTIFDETLTQTDKFLKSSKWKSAISFNGGHAHTEAIMKANFNDAQVKTSFSNNTYTNLVKNYEEKIKKGEIKSGDQLMIMIDAHGAAKDLQKKEVTHNIAIGEASAPIDLNNLNVTSTISLDTLQNLTTLAKEKGIKLAILDFSCHSGNTLSLANENTCVISSTGTMHFGYSNFVSNFTKKMKAGISLEDVFLSTRKETADNSFPMISTEEGKAINNDFYPAITPYLYYYDEDEYNDKMTEYLLSASTKNGLCQRHRQYDDLLSQLEGLYAVSTLNANKSLPEIEQIKALIADYKNKQDRYINLVRSWGIQELNHKEMFVGSGVVGKQKETMKGNFTWKDLIESDLDRIIKNISSAKLAAKDPQTQAAFEASIEMHTKAREKQREILARYPNLKNYKHKFHEALNEFQGTYAIANKIALEERKLYDKMYELLKEEKKKMNACSGFIL
jgi:hypothetical protein